MEVLEDIGFGGVAPLTSVFETPLAELPIPSLPLLPALSLSSGHPHPAFEQSLLDWSELFPHPHPSLPPVSGRAGQDTGLPSGHPGDDDEELDDDEAPPDEELVLEELLLLELLLLELLLLEDQ